MKPITLVQSVDTAIANISVYNGALHNGADEDVRRLIPNVQAWYATERDGDILFGPSKFIGYTNMTAQLYAAETGASGRLDGRVTEKRLAPWARLITKDDPEYTKFHEALASFCADYASFPNKRARISVFLTPGEVGASTEDAQVKALSVLISALSDEGKRNLKKLVWP